MKCVDGETINFCFLKFFLIAFFWDWNFENIRKCTQLTPNQLHPTYDLILDIIANFPLIYLCQGKIPLLTICSHLPPSSWNKKFEVTFFIIFTFKVIFFCFKFLSFSAVWFAQSSWVMIQERWVEEKNKKCRVTFFRNFDF